MEPAVAATAVTRFATIRRAPAAAALSCASVVDAPCSDAGRATLSIVASHSAGRLAVLDFDFSRCASRTVVRGPIRVLDTRGGPVGWTPKGANSIAPVAFDTRFTVDHLRDRRSEPAKAAKSTAYRQTDGKSRNERSHVGKVLENQARPERSDQDEANSNASSTDHSGREGSTRRKCALEQQVMAFFGSLSSRKVRWGREPTVIGWSRPERSAQDEGQQ